MMWSSLCTKESNKTYLLVNLKETVGPRDVRKLVSGTFACLQLSHQLEGPVFDRFWR